VAGGSLDGVGEASDAEERTARTKEDERGDGSKEGPEPGNLPEDEGQSSSEASTGGPNFSGPNFGDPNFGGPGLVFDTAVLQGGAIEQHPEPDSEAKAVPGIGPEQVSGLEIREGSVGETSQELFDAERAVEGAANGHSSEPIGSDVGSHPAVAPPDEPETSVATEGGSGPTSQDDGEDEEALNAEGPVVHEAITDPEVPSHIRFEQAKTMAQALAKGEPNTVRIVKQLLKGKLREFHYSLAKADSGSVYTN
jgi:hypothetical protein